MYKNKQPFVYWNLYNGNAEQEMLLSVAAGGGGVNNLYYIFGFTAMSILVKLLMSVIRGLTVYTHSNTTSWEQPIQAARLVYPPRTVKRSFVLDPNTWVSLGYGCFSEGTAAATRMGEHG